MSRGSGVVAPTLAINIVFYAPYLNKEGAGNVSLRLADTLTLLLLLLLLLFTLSAFLRTILWPKRDGVTWEWRKLHNEKLSDLYTSPNIFRVIKSRRVSWAGLVARMGERRVAYRVLVKTPEGKRSLGRPRHIWEDNIKMGLQEVRCGGMGWIDVALDRDRWRAVINFPVT